MEQDILWAAFFWPLQQRVPSHSNLHMVIWSIKLQKLFQDLLLVKDDASQTLQTCYEGFANIQLGDDWHIAIIFYHYTYDRHRKNQKRTWGINSWNHCVCGMLFKSVYEHIMVFLRDCWWFVNAPASRLVAKLPPLPATREGDFAFL